MATVTYCTAAQVAQFLQTTDFSGSTTPTDSVVEDMIVRNEDHIDDVTGHSWKAVQVSDEYQNPTDFDQIGLRFDLIHREIKTFSNGQGDKIEIWDGTSFEDYVVNKTEGLDEDYFVDETNGVVWIRDKTSVALRGARFTYRYGGDSVPKDIEQACIKLTAIDILQQFDNVQNFADDGPSNRLDINSRIERLRRDVNKILSSRAEIVVL